MSEFIRVGILGDFNPYYHTHEATNRAIEHAASKLGLRVQGEWLPTLSLLQAAGEASMAQCDGLWASPGSPYKSFDGMLRGIEFARTRNWPFLGT
jgi:CTP synthase (UTP-ammonia lyase)